ncbi:MAG: hypothetical protein WB646_06760 [Steroidobacteraceae bacterium]
MARVFRLGAAGERRRYGTRSKRDAEIARNTIAMTGLGAIQTSLCASLLVAALVILPIEYQLYRRLRRHHRKTFDRLRIDSPSFLWREDRDAEDTVFAHLFSSRTHETLNDPRLNALVRLKGYIWLLCGVSLALLLSTFLIFRADPAHVWGFLVDLSRY